MRHLTSCQFLGIFLLAASLSSGCANVPMKYRPVLFKDYSEMRSQCDLDKVRIASGANLSDYQTIVISPVDRLDIRIGDLNHEEKGQVLEHILKSFRVEMVKHFSTVTIDPSAVPRGEKALRLDLAFPEMRATDVMTNLIVGFGAGNATATIEGRLVDMETGEELIAFADRKKGSGFTKKEWEDEGKSWVSADLKRLKYLFLFGDTWAENFSRIVASLRKA